MFIKLIRCHSQKICDMFICYVCSTAKVKEYKGSNLLSFTPDVKKIMSKSRDPEELQYYWEQWREQTGQKMVDQYKQYIDLYNEAAELNEFR